MEARVSRLEQGIRDVQSAVGRLETTTGKLEERMARVELAVARIEAMLSATLPHLATKAEIAAGFADKPSKTYMWGILAALLTAYACGLAGLAFLK
jgi:hypothetical protein